MFELEINYRSRNGKIAPVQSLTGVKLAKEDIADFITGTSISAAMQFRDNIIGQGRFPKENYVIIIGNRVVKDEFSARPFQTISYKTKLETLTPALKDAARLIFDRSPVRRGAYLANNVLFKNNVLVAKGYTNILTFLDSDSPDDKDIYRFVNVTPYARKLERRGVRRETQGRNKGRNTRPENKRIKQVKGVDTVVPNGAYVLANRALRRKYKELKQNIRFSFIPIEPSVVRRIDTSGRDTTGYVFAKNREGKGAGRPYLYPSITMTVNKETVGFNRGFTESI